MTYVGGALFKNNQLWGNNVKRRQRWIKTSLQATQKKIIETKE